MFFVSCSTISITSHTYSKPVEDLNLIFDEISECANGVYSGISGVYSTTDKMMSEALMDAAKNVLIHNKAALKTQTYGEDSDNSFLLLFDDHIQYSDVQLLSVINKLEIISIKFSDSLGCVVLTKYADSTDDFPPFNLKRNEDNVPLWIKGNYEVPGYIIGIGRTMHYSNVWSSIEAADYLSVDSIFAQVRDIDGFVIHNQILNNGAYRDQSYQGNINSISGAKIIARYYDKKNDIYYSFALLKEE
jgi:hypothetical protein